MSPFGSGTIENLIAVLKRHRVDEAKIIINLYKDVTPCYDCHQILHRSVMTFDHVKRSSKRCNVTECTTMTTMVAELRKCQLVCLNCHKLREFKRDNLTLSIRSFDVENIFASIPDLSPLLFKRTVLRNYLIIE